MKKLIVFVMALILLAPAVFGALVNPDAPVIGYITADGNTGTESADFRALLTNNSIMNFSIVHLSNKWSNLTAENYDDQIDIYLVGQWLGSPYDYDIMNTSKGVMIMTGEGFENEPFTACTSGKEYTTIRILNNTFYPTEDLPLYPGSTYDRFTSFKDSYACDITQPLYFSSSHEAMWQGNYDENVKGGWYFEPGDEVNGTVIQARWVFFGTSDMKASDFTEKTKNWTIKSLKWIVESLEDSGPSSSHPSESLILNMTFDDGFVDHALNRTFTVNGDASPTNSSICKWYGCGNFSVTDGSDYLNSTLQTTLHDGIAISMWVYFNVAPKDSGANSHYMFSMGHVNDDNRFYVGSTYWGHSTLIPTEINGINTGDGSIHADSADIWYHLFWQYNESQLTIWKNGEVTLNATYDYGEINFTTAQQIFIGRIAPWGTSNLMGYLDELLVWNSSDFTTDDVRAIYFSQKDGTPPNLDLYLANFTYTLPINWSHPNNTLMMRDMQINLTIRNAGVLNASSFKYNFSLSGTQVCSGTISSLNAQSSTIISCTWTPSYGFHVGQVSIDVNDEVNEDSESNNNVTVYVPFLNRPFMLFNLSDLPEMRDHCNNVTGTLTSMEKDICDWIKSFSGEGDFSESYTCNDVDPYGTKGRKMALGCAMNDYGNINPSKSEEQCSKAKNHLKGWANRTITQCTSVQALHDYASVVLTYDIMFPNLTQAENEEIVSGLYEKCQYFTRELIKPYLDDPDIVDGNNGFGFGAGFGTLCYGLLGAYSKNPSMLLERDDTYDRPSTVDAYFRRERTFLYSWKNQSWAQYQEGRAYLTYAMPHLAENLYFESRFGLNNYTLFTNPYCAITREVITTFLDDHYSGLELMNAKDYNMRFLQRGDSESYKKIDDSLYPDWAWPTMIASLCPDTTTREAYAWVRMRAHDNGDDNMPYPTLYVFRDFFESTNHTKAKPDSVMPRVIMDNANDIFTVRTNYTYINDTILYIDGGEERGGGHSQAQGYYLYALGEPFLDYEQVPYEDDTRAEYWKNGISLQNTTQPQEGVGGVWTSTCGEAPINQYWGSYINNAAQDCNSSLSDWPDFRRFPLKYGGDLEDYYGEADGDLAGVYVWRPYYLADPVQEYFVKVGNAVFKRTIVKNNYQGDGVYHNLISLARLFNYTVSGTNLTQERNGKYMLTSLLWANTSMTLGGGETNLTACLSKTSCSGSTATNTNYTRYYYYSADDNVDFVISHHWYSGSPTAISVASGGDEVISFGNYTLAFDVDGDGLSELSGATSDGWALIQDGSTYASFNFTNITEGSTTLILTNVSTSGRITSTSDHVRVRINPVQRRRGLDYPVPVRVRVYVGGLSNNSNYTVYDEDGNSLSFNKSGDYITFDAPAATSESLSGVTYTITAASYSAPPVPPVYSLTVLPADFRQWIVADAYTYAKYPDTNYGSETNLIVSQPDAGTQEHRTYLTLNLSEIPFPSNNMSSVILDLYRHSYYINSASDYYLYLCIDSDGFDETGITWNNQDTQVTNCTYISEDTTISTGWEHYNLTQAISSIQVVRIVSSHDLYAIDSESFYSRESNTNPPQLNITYYGNFTIFARNAYTGEYFLEFNATVNGVEYATTTGILTTNVMGNSTANITVTVPGNFFTSTYSSQDTSTSMIAEVYPYTEIYAVDGNTGLEITNFTVTYQDLSSSANGTVSTTNGTAPIPLYNSTYEVTITSGTDYAPKIVNLTASPYLQNYTFTLYPYNSVYIYIYEEETGNIVTDNVSVTMSGPSVYENSTTTGQLSFERVDTGEYSVTFSSDAYTTRTYYITVGEGTTQTLNAYLINSTSTVIFTIKDRMTGNTIEGAIMNVARNINSSWTTIAALKSDITGRIQLYYQTGKEYKFTITKSGYEDKTFTLSPILFSEYDVYLDRTSAYDSTTDYSRISVSHTSTFYDGQNNDFEFVITAPDGELTNYTVNVSYPGGTFTHSGNNAYGERISTTLPINNSIFGDTVKITYTYSLSNHTEKTFSNEYFIIINATIEGTFFNNKIRDYGMGKLERTIVGTIGILLTAGTATFFAGPLAGGAIGMIMLGLYAYIGLWDLWAVLISILVGFIILAWRSGQ